MVYTYLIGRSRTATDSMGTRIHAVEVDGTSYPAFYGKAICGAKPARRSNGWSEYRTAAPTCPKCIAKLAKLQEQSA
jgi:hypothetical protein